ncbi:MAG: DUF4180 domain-containing protein, partial [Eubacteriales bacterium]
MEIVTQNELIAAVIDKEEKLTDVKNILDIMADARYLHCCNNIIIYKESLGDRFFDLKTGYAGEILQKFSNYKMKLAVIGDLSVYNSKSLRDFIYECNNG